MDKIKKWLEPKKNKVIAGLIAVLVIAGGGYGVWTLTQAKSSEPVIVFNENIMFEYGENVEQDAIIDKVINKEKSDYTSVSRIITIDVSSVTISLDEEGNEHLSDKRQSTLIVDKDGTEKEFTFDYDVKDTQAPIIEDAEDMETPYGSELKFEDIITATDLVDGKVKLIVEGELDTSKAGQYEMKAIATDNNGKEKEKTFVVTVLEEEKPVEEPETPSTQAPSNSAGGTSSTNKPSSNTGNTSTTKPAEPSKPTETPKPTEPEKPVEQPKPVEPSKPDREAPTGMLLFKDYGTFDLCNADIHKQAKSHVWE